MSLEQLFLSFILLALSPTVQPYGRSLRDDDLKQHPEDDFINWEERCVRKGGKLLLNAWLSSQEELVYCVMQNFDFEEIQCALEQRTSQGGKGGLKRESLEVLVKYCGLPLSQSLPCLRNFFDVSSQCLDAGDEGSLNVTMSMIETTAQFLCQKRAKRLSSFVHYQGMECLSDQFGPISTCINASFPEVLLMNNQKRFDLIVFNHRNCMQLDTIRYCVEREMLKCPRTEPLRLLESLLSRLRKRSQCHQISQYSLLSGVSSSASRPSGGILALLLLSMSVTSFRQGS
eukprot:TRINITY_DN555_c1_g1_i1.p1 TRINITY_DN555_c1_g1~~TRINITY_DN555_c1_g1_i1.p1  ORF type:complete len:287 (+),score=85.81 TRINITY_DN555_c1_g1_i1:298-1158(+)